MRFNNKDHYENKLAAKGDKIGLKLKMVQAAKYYNVDRFIVGDTGLEILDTQNAVIWRRKNHMGLTWNDVQQTLVRLNRKGLKWRLPTIDELCSIIYHGSGQFYRVFKHYNDAGSLLYPDKNDNLNCIFTSNAYWTSTTGLSENIHLLLIIHTDTFYNTKIYPVNSQTDSSFSTLKFSARFIRDE